MKCLGCGGVWFIEERHILPSAPPASDGAKALPTRVRFAYTCAGCGLSYGQKPRTRSKRKVA